MDRTKDTQKVAFAIGPRQRPSGHLAAPNDRQHNGDRYNPVAVMLEPMRYMVATDW
jgi:hypothetical protein